MRVLFFGLGSIGQRHARLLQEEFPSYDLAALRTRRGQTPCNVQLKEFASWQEADGFNADVSFVTNPTDLHIQTALECAKKSMHLFVEKPLGCSVAGLDDLEKEIQSRNLCSYVGYHLRFHPVVDFLKKYLDLSKIEKVEIECRSYLPDWRPGQDVRHSYSARVDKGGGVLLDVSHEIDYASYLFGPILNLEGTLEKRANVTVDAEDYASLSLSTGGVKGIRITLDFVSKEWIRIIKVSFKDGKQWTADLNAWCVKDQDNEEVATFEPDVDANFRRQLRYFFANLNNPGMMNNVVEAGALLRKIIAVRESHN